METDSAIFDPEQQASNMESKIVVALERIAEAFRVLLWEQGKEFSLSPIQVQALIFLLYHSPGRAKVSKLAEEFNMTRPTISDMVKTLEQKGLVEKLTEPEDRRSHILRLTEKGAGMAQRASLFAEEIRRPLAAIAPNDKADLLLHLISIIRHLNAAGVITVQRMCFTCAHYRPNHHGQAHFCSLLNTKLETADLRVDCPEHALLAE